LYIATLDVIAKGVRNIALFIFFTFTLSFLFLGRSVAQDFQVERMEGVVVDTAGNALRDVNVRLVSARDTLNAVTDKKGFYRFRKIKGQQILISYSLLSYKIVSRSYSIYDSTQVVFIPNIVLTPQYSWIQEVNITKTIPVIYKQDTIQYNMSAFDLRKNALLEESLKQLPGIHVGRDGSVYSAGKLITTVKVDGKKFFGGDVLTATRNLPTDFIKQIQIINSHENSEYKSSFEEKESETIINILLKEDKKKILFGQITAGAGTSERSIASAGLNAFNDGREVSLVASFNNTNTSLFSFGSPNGLGGRAQSLSDIGDFSEPVDGLNNVSALGMTFMDQIGSRIQVNGGYQYTYKEKFLEGYSRLTSNYVGNQINNSEEYINRTYDSFHKIFLEMESKFKNGDTFKFSPTFTYNNSYLNSQKSRQLQSKNIVNKGDYSDRTRIYQPAGEISMLYSKNFANPKRKLMANVQLKTDRSEKKEDVFDYYWIADSTTSNPTYDEFDQKQFVENSNSTNSLKASVRYVEPFFDHSLLEITHDFDLTEIYATRLVEDLLLGSTLGHPVYVDSLGVNYNYLFRSNRTGINYTFEPNNVLKTNIGMAVEPLRMSGQLPSNQINYNFERVNLIPTASIRFRFNQELDWQLQYNGRNNQPNFMQLMPATDNSNSRFIIVGNPELKAEYINKISTTLRKAIMTRSQYFEANLAYNFTNNKIVTSKRDVDNSTIQETTFENADGYYDVRGYYVFNTPLSWHENIFLDLNGNVDFYNSVSYVNKLKNNTQQLLLAQNMQLKYNWTEAFEALFNANYLLNQATFQLPYYNKITSQSFFMSLAGRSYLGDRLMVGAEMSQKFYQGVNKDLINVSPTLINAYVEFTFMKNNLGMLRLQAFDLLDQDKSMGIFTEYVGNDIYESRNNRLGRYFMLTLNFRLQKYPKNK